jgi:N-glycosidase YbiA
MSILFNSKSPAYCWLSNFFISSMTLHGKEYLSVEHWFQSQKFTNPEVQEEIRLASTPASAKAMGKKKEASFRKDWDSVREDIMMEGLRAKFHQNIFLYVSLCNTEDTELKEDSSWDSYWGIGKFGKGKNRMGYLLMKLRSEIKNA